MRMLQVRNSVKINDGVVLHDTATAGFLSEGKYVLTYRHLTKRFLLPSVWSNSLLAYISGQASSQIHTCWQWCTSGKCVSGPWSMRTVALTPWIGKKIACSFGTLALRSSTNTCSPARDLCKARVGTRRMPRKFLVFYSEQRCSCVEVAPRHRSKFSIQMCVDPK